MCVCYRFVLRNYGISGLQNYIRKHIDLAKRFEKHVLKDKRFEICNEVKVNIVWPFKNINIYTTAIFSLHSLFIVIRANNCTCLILAWAGLLSVSWLRQTEWKTIEHYQRFGKIAYGASLGQWEVRHPILRRSTKCLWGRYWYCHWYSQFLCFFLRIKFQFV